MPARPCQSRVCRTLNRWIDRVRAVLARLWADDRGGVIAAEYAATMGLVVFGGVAGLVAIRDQANALCADCVAPLRGLAPAATYSGWQAGPQRKPVAAVGGAGVQPHPATYLPAP